MQWAALIQYHFHVDVDEISDDKFAQLVGRLEYALKKTDQWKQ